MKERRSVYNLGNNIKKSKEELNALVLRAVELSPSSFNSQSSRVVILWGNHSHKLWDITKDELLITIAKKAFESISKRRSLPIEKFDKTWNESKNDLIKLVGDEQLKTIATKLDSFARGSGTILFFEDSRVIDKLQEQFPSYADNFPLWSEQSSGMAQFAVWAALTEAGLGASLQHYNPLIDEKTRETFNISSDWKLKAQMPFGSIEDLPSAKDFMPHSERFIIFE